MKKSKIFIIVSCVLVIALFIFAYFVYDSIFPKAGQLQSPHPDTILSFTVTDDKQNEIKNVNIYTFYDFILNAEPTRVMSVNDYPDTRPYYEVQIHSSDEKYYRYYCYSAKGKTYIEVPYIGVYEVTNFEIDDLF